jgi:hypothetical protein
MRRKPLRVQEGATLPAGLLAFFARGSTSRTSLLPMTHRLPYSHLGCVAVACSHGPRRNVINRRAPSNWFKRRTVPGSLLVSARPPR